MNNFYTNKSDRLNSQIPNKTQMTEIQENTENINTPITSKEFSSLKSSHKGNSMSRWLRW